MGAAVESQSIHCGQAHGLPDEPIRLGMDGFGRAMDTGGYYHPNPDKVKTDMRPSATFNKILATLG